MRRIIGSRLAPWHFHRSAPFQIPHFRLFSPFSCVSVICFVNSLRRERDLNPRYPSGYIRLPIVHLRPLGHLSNMPLATLGAGGIRGSSRGRPVRSLHPRLRAPGAYVPTGRLPIGMDLLHRQRQQSWLRRCGVIHAPHNRSRLTPWHYHRSAPFRIPNYWL